MTPEEAVLLGFVRGYCCRQIDNEESKGVMALVKLGKNEIADLLPEGVYIACQTASSSVTITGPQQVVRDFVTTLNNKGIFAKVMSRIVNAFHSKYIEEPAKYLLEFVKGIITNPKRRSSKWISTSVPLLKNQSSVHCPEYYYNSFRNPVLFDQILEIIPKNAIVVEVAPHGLLQGILRAELPSTVTVTSLLDRESRCNTEHFLSAIGR